MDGFRRDVILPEPQLMELEFLLGDAVGTEVSHPSLGKTSMRLGCWHATRERCERFVHIHYLSAAENGLCESFTAMLSFSQSEESYVLWLFSGHSGDPIRFEGKLEDNKLVLLSEPQMFGDELQKVRATFFRDNGDLMFQSEYWTPDGYMTVREARLHEHPLPV